MAQREGDRERPGGDGAEERGRERPEEEAEEEDVPGGGGREEEAEEEEEERGEGGGVGSIAGPSGKETRNAGVELTTQGELGGSEGGESHL